MKIGLCQECSFHSLTSGKSGSEFHLCRLSRIDPTFPKYPRLPVLRCTGFKKTESKGRSAVSAHDKD